MTTNDSGRLNTGGVAAIKEITAIPAADWTERQRYRLNACLTALAHQPQQWYGYQDWGAEGPVNRFLADRGIRVLPSTRPTPPWAGLRTTGAGCGQEHWRISKAHEPRV